MNITTQAIVLHHADYRENDRMLTLLTPDMGRVDALARGCKKPGSPLLAGAELFAFGEYVLFRGRGRATVVSCSIIDSFYDLRTDYDRLRYASYMLQVINAQALPAERPGRLFLLLLRSFKRLCYMDLDARAVTAAFLLMDAALSGYRPRLHHCVRCGRRIDTFLDTAADGSANHPTNSAYAVKENTLRRGLREAADERGEQTEVINNDGEFHGQTGDNCTAEILNINANNKQSGEQGNAGVTNIDGERLADGGCGGLTNIGGECNAHGDYIPKFSEARLFDIEEGGLVCRDCERADLPAVPVSAREIAWLRDVLTVGIEKTTRPPAEAPLPLLMRYMESRLETHLPSGKGLR